MRPRTTTPVGLRCTAPAVAVLAVLAVLAASPASGATNAVAGWREAVRAATSSRGTLSVVCIGESNTEMTTYAGALRESLGMKE